MSTRKDRFGPFGIRGEISFCTRLEKCTREALEQSPHRTIYCPEGAEYVEGKEIIRCAQPRLEFIKRMIQSLACPSYIGVDSTARVEACVKMGARVRIGAYSVIGSPGFGYELDGERPVHFPHIGGVILGDWVEIGANTCIDRGTLGDTIIGKYTKIDNLVHIAHNVRVGQNCMIVAHAMIGGGAVIGNHCWIAPHACIRDGITIGDNVTVGMGAVVTKDVPSNQTVIGIPAKER